MTGTEYQRAALRTASDGNVDQPLVLGALGLAGESGEVVDLIKKFLAHGHELDTTKIVLELGDVLWYCALLARAVGTDLDAVMAANIEKLLRRYPDGFDSARSINREAQHAA